MYNQLKQTNNMEKGFIIMDNFGGYVNTIVDMETGLAKVFSSKKEAE